MARQLYLVCYDIRNDARRDRILARVRRHCLDSQLSVHECWLYPAEHHLLIQDLSVLIEDTEDRVHVLRCEVAPAHAHARAITPETIWVIG